MRRRPVADAARERRSDAAEHLRLVGALDLVPDGVLVVDETGAEVVRNQAAERFRDARHGEALAEQAINALLEAALRGEPGERDLPLFGPPREVLTIHAVPLTDGDEILGAVAFVRDVTETRRVESVRRDFVANVSHELKTPVGALALLAETIASSDELPVVQSLALQLVREADRLSRIVDDLLDLSTIEAQETPTRERVALRVLLDEAADRLGPMALAHGIPLRVLQFEDVTVECDPAQLISAVTNLLDNAVKYSDAGRPVELGAYLEDGRAVIAIRDEGIGIPASELERIFERFYRVDKARSRATGGTGLGLAIVRHAVQVHGGEVTVESVEGEGTTFRIFLPAIESPSSEREPAGGAGETPVAPIDGRRTPASPTRDARSV